MTTTVLVLSDEGRTALGTLDNVRPVGYDPAGPMPEEAADAEVLVVPFRHTQRTLAAMREMPKLRLVQTLSAGTEVWQGRAACTRCPGCSVRTTPWSIMVPYSEETHHLVDAAFLARCRAVRSWTASLAVMRSVTWAAVADIGCVLLFVVIGRASHSKGETLAAWPARRGRSWAGSRPAGWRGARGGSQPHSGRPGSRPGSARWPWAWCCG